MPIYDGTAVDDKRGGFSLLEPGEYLLKIESILVKKTKNEDPMWVLKLVHSGGKNWIFDRIIWSDKAKTRLKQFLKCAEMYKDGPQDYNPALFEGKILQVKVGIQKCTWGKYQGRDENFVPYDGYHTYDEQPGGATDTSDVPFA